MRRTGAEPTWSPAGPLSVEVRGLAVGGHQPLPLGVGRYPHLPGSFAVIESRHGEPRALGPLDGCAETEPERIVGLGLGPEDEIVGLPARHPDLVRPARPAHGGGEESQRCEKGKRSGRHGVSPVDCWRSSPAGSAPATPSGLPARPRVYRPRLAPATRTCAVRPGARRRLAPRPLESLSMPLARS